MSGAITFLDFEDWIRFVFDHPGEGPEWYWDADAPYWDAPSALTAAHVSRLFEDPVPALARFTDAQINRGLWYLISPGLGEHMLCLDDPLVPLAERVRCVQACAALFRALLAPRCAPLLSHRNEPGRAPINLVCYMWWDIMPVHGGPQADDRSALQAASLRTMADILSIDHVACQESALHGLGHWHHMFPADVEALIDGFLRDNAGARAELLTYARNARCGCVL